MKNLIKQYLDRGISRRQLLSGLGAVGISATAASAMAHSLSPFLPPADEQAAAPPPSWMREMQGTGGALFVAQLKAAGVEHIFFNPSSEISPVFDALVDEPGIHLILALQEGAITAMADGYAKASGKVPVVICARPGFPNAMTQMFNSWKDQIPMVVVTDYLPHGGLGQDGFEDADHMEVMAQPITKWYWVAQSADKIPEVTRRAMKFASTVPCAPVFLAFPSDTLHDEAKATIMDQAKFDVPMKIRPGKDQVEQVARLLLEAKNPLLYVGDEITWCGAQKDVVELAELLGVPVSREATDVIGWSVPFPNRHPLFVGGYLPEMRFPGEVDVMVNLGSRLPWGERVRAETKLVQVRLDPSNLARTAPTDVAIVADIKLAAQDLVAAVRSMATDARLKQIAEARAVRTREYTAKMWDYRQAIAREHWDRSPVSIERLAVELEAVLDKDTCYVADVDSGKKMENLMSFGGSDKQYFSTSGAALGWGLPASFGVKLARPDLPVVAVLGDGGFLFSGPMPLWSFARYKVPVAIIVMNNRSYNNERNRIWNSGGKQFQVGRDMSCYLGDPDIDYTKAAAAFGVEGELVAEASALRGALERAKRATADGRAYLLDVHTERGGLGAASTWYPAYSLADLRRRKV
jgi:thiamine pyrophosphate-dependent acetolactate synthase large subunit-like protein